MPWVWDRETALGVSVLTKTSHITILPPISAEKNSFNLDLEQLMCINIKFLQIICVVHKMYIIYI